MYHVEVFADGGRVVTVGSDSRAVVWSASSGEALASLERLGKPAHRKARVLQDGSRIVTGASGASQCGATIWATASGEALQDIVQPTGRVRLLELSPRGDRFVTVGERSAWMWDAASGARVRGPVSGHATCITGAAFAEGPGS